MKDKNMKYSSILLKLSGESLGGKEGRGLDAQVLETYAREIKPLAEAGIRISIVVGGGNIFRGLKGTLNGYDRVHGDQMGMLATTINSIALADALQALGLKAIVYTATPMRPIARYYQRDEVLRKMEKGTIVLLSGGTGNPFFTTDSAAALRAVELGVGAVLKGTRVDGVYSDDPEKNPHATRFDSLTFDQVLEKNLRIMDMTAFTLCRENNMPIVVFDMNGKGNLQKVVNGQKTGTIIK
ncbi:MAG TPA: UMP kinase [Bacteroidales bacterium]|jgi:uridylate kinase|nr:MAG: Uridylate kinase [Bacteroidetes bacterium ADurb.Bin139]HOG25748.1 UMP kinase [Bacteroidales bacterium]HOR12119.1 UMP kinase [Bacteroidales bacterium]HOZ20098.1 UMP kinase [Bacteroidales bacterium]HPK38678.1 UMP kinase [Bacteroidales bacterium]